MTRAGGWARTQAQAPRVRARADAPPRGAERRPAFHLRRIRLRLSPGGNRQAQKFLAGSRALFAPQLRRRHLAAGARAELCPRAGLWGERVGATPAGPYPIPTAGSRRRAGLGDPGAPAVRGRGRMETRMRTRFRRRVGTPGPRPGSPRQTPGFHLRRGSRQCGPEWREAAGALRGSAARGQRQAACVRSLVCGEVGGGACSPEARGRLSSFPPQGTSFLVPAPLCFLEPGVPSAQSETGSTPCTQNRFCCGILSVRGGAGGVQRRGSLWF